MPSPTDKREFIFRARQENIGKEPQNQDDSNWEFIGIKGKDGEDIAIDDNLVSDKRIYSSQKINSEIEKKLDSFSLTPELNDNVTEMSVEDVVTSEFPDAVHNLVFKGFGKVKKFSFKNNEVDYTTNTGTKSVTLKSGGTDTEPNLGIKMKGFGKVNTATMSASITQNRAETTPLANPTLSCSVTGTRDLTMKASLNGMEEGYTHYIYTAEQFVSWVNKAHQYSGTFYGELVIVKNITVNIADIPCMSTTASRGAGYNENLSIRGLSPKELTGTYSTNGCRTITLTGKASSQISTNLFSYMKLENIAIEVKIDYSSITTNDLSQYVCKNCECDKVEVRFLHNPSNSYGHFYAFHNCYNLVNCRVVVGSYTKGTGQSSEIANSGSSIIGFGNCYGLLGCDVHVASGSRNTKPGSYNSDIFYAFQSCQYLYGCQAFPTSNTGSDFGMQYYTLRYCYKECKHIYNCMGNLPKSLSGSGSSYSTDYIFYYCTNVYSCYACHPESDNRFYRCSPYFSSTTPSSNLCDNSASGGFNSRYSSY